MDRLSSLWETVANIDIAALAIHIDWKTYLAYAIGLFLIYLLGRLLYVPMRLIFPLFVNGLIGIVLLLLFNLIGGFLGLRLAINPVTALVAGFLGIPGVGLLIALQLLLGLS